MFEYIENTYIPLIFIITIIYIACFIWFYIRPLYNIAFNVKINKKFLIYFKNQNFDFTLESVTQLIKKTSTDIEITPALIVIHLQNFLDYLSKKNLSSEYPTNKILNLINEISKMPFNHLNEKDGKIFQNILSSTKRADLSLTQERLDIISNIIVEKNKSISQLHYSKTINIISWIIGIGGTISFIISLYKGF